VEPISLILAALAAGASAGISGTVSRAVQDSYAGLRAKVVDALRGDPESVKVLERHETQPQLFHDEMRQLVSAQGLHEDQGLLQAAQLFLALVDPAGAAKGRYSIDARDSQGLIAGDHNTVTQHFGSLRDGTQRES
jgi:hypothetical protein